MEKKSSKIAYLIACLIIVGLLIFLALKYPDGVYGTFWSLLPPIVAIALALISKEVYSSLFFGCLTGAILYSNFGVWDTITSIVGGEVGLISVLSDEWDMGILIFLVILGIMVDLMNKSGGSAAFGRWAREKVKTRRSSQLITMLLGVIIFVDDYFNCLTVGSVMRPVTENHRISRAKLAYIIDATAAPVCMIAPVSSWAAAVSGYVNSDNISGIRMFLRQIPYNYYCLLTLIMVIFLAIFNFDYGPMLKHEYNAQVKNDLFTTEHRPFAGDDAYAESDQKGSVMDLIIPVIVLIVMCIIGMIWTGGFFEGETFMDAFAACDASVGLPIGAMVALAFTFVYFWIRGAIGFTKSFDSIPQGFIQMISPILILTLAWTLNSMTGSLGSDIFVKSVLGNAENLQKFLPVIIFIFSCVIAFATGTSWGTIGIMAPIVVQVFDYNSTPELCVIGLAAACAGGVCGDHCSPISDTTIMASAGAHCYHLNHVTTQLPYAATVTLVSAVGFILAGFLQNVILCLAIEIALMLVVLFVIKYFTKMNHKGLYAEMKEAQEKMV